MKKKSTNSVPEHSLHVLHLQTLKKLNTNKNIVNKKKEELIELEDKLLKEYNKEKHNISKIAKLKSDISNIQLILCNNPDADILRYFETNGEILTKYYKLGDHSNEVYLPQCGQGYITANNRTRMITRAGLKYEYLYRKGDVPERRVPEDICHYCEVTMIRSPEGYLVCPTCSCTKVQMCDGEVSVTKDNTLDLGKNTSKKRLHLIDKLNKVEYNKKIHISKEVISKIKEYFKEQNKTTVTIADVYNAIKKLKLKEYYQYYYCVYIHLTNVQPITIPKDIREKLHSKLDIAYSTYNEHIVNKNQGCSVFVGYDYFIRNALISMGYLNYAKLFPLNKTEEKLSQYDKTWEKICQINGWAFKASI